MDFGSELFWIAMVIFYLVFQILGARKKKQQHQKRRPAERRPQPVSRPPEEETELDEALREIRRALGFPDEQREAPRPPQEPAPERAEPVSQPAESTPRRAESPAQTAQPIPRPGEYGARRTESMPRPIEKMPPRSLPPDRPTKIPPVVREPQIQRYPPGRTARPARGILTSPKSEALIAESPVMQPVEAPKGTRLPRLVEQLQNPSTAREAFLMKEILDPPKALRKRR